MITINGYNKRKTSTPLAYIEDLAMTTTSNQILWTIRDIEDTEVLKTALIEIERIIYSLSRAEHQENPALQLALDNATPAIYAVIHALPEEKTSTIDGTKIEA